MATGKQKSILEGSHHSVPGPISLVEYFQEGIQLGRISLDQTALNYEEKQYTFADLDRFSTKLAQILWAEIGGNEILNLNPNQDVVIGLCLPPSEKLIYCIFAILKLGASYVPFDQNFPTDLVYRIVENCRPVLIISDCDPTCLNKFDTVLKLTQVNDVESIFSRVDECISEQSLNQLKTNIQKMESLPGLPVMSERAAIILYTSGSSGEPNGVRVTHR
jgi:acyl-coenzyme A synthetase/AMP-(fatty) acid ligase